LAQAILVQVLGSTEKRAPRRGEMAFRLVSVLFIAIHASASVEVETCSGGECPNDENSLLVLRSVSSNLTKWFAKWGLQQCFNSDGLPFACGAGKCCGNACKADGDLCCENNHGYKFPCGSEGGGSCCGNACAGAGSKCCNKGKPGYEYPVAEGDACTDESITCTNSQNLPFVCGKGSTCCGDICATPGSTCCQGVSHNFACGPGSKCCGNSCQAPGSKCCEGGGLPYPVTKGTKCAGSGPVVCENQQGHEFMCAAHNTCCGGTCVAPGGACCLNSHGNHFPCAKGSKCCGDICLAQSTPCHGGRWWQK